MVTIRREHPMRIPKVTPDITTTNIPSEFNDCFKCFLRLSFALTSSMF